MKLSTRTRYGLRALIEMAKRSGQTPVKRREIAAAQRLTKGYLENILSVLRSRKFVRAARGAGGGFFLARPSALVSVWEIVAALEGSTAPVDCIENPDSCDRTQTCAARIAWMRLYEAQKSALAALTLEDLAAMERQGIAEDFNI